MTLNNRELATVLAALRYWQREGLMSAGHEQDIATDGDTFEPLNAEDIDALCERLNCEPSEPPSQILEGDLVEDFDEWDGHNGGPQDENQIENYIANALPADGFPPDQARRILRELMAERRVHAEIARQQPPTE
jgi:hypothetical protein